MRNLRVLSPGFLVMMFCLLIARSVYADQPAGLGPPSPAECEAALAQGGITVELMDFGTYVGGTSGTIELDVDNRLIHNSVVSASGAMGRAAIITLTPSGKNCDKHDVTFTMPASININNLSGSPATTITITNLTNDLVSNPFQIRHLPSGKIRMGGTLNATSGDAQATYSGPYNVTFTY